MPLETVQSGNGNGGKKCKEEVEEKEEEEQVELMGLELQWLSHHL